MKFLFFFFEEAKSHSCALAPANIYAYLNHFRLHRVRHSLKPTPVLTKSNQHSVRSLQCLLPDWETARRLLSTQWSPNHTPDCQERCAASCQPATIHTTSVSRLKKSSFCPKKLWPHQFVDILFGSAKKGLHIRGHRAIKSKTVAQVAGRSALFIASPGRKVCPRKERNNADRPSLSWGKKCDDRRSIKTGVPFEVYVELPEGDVVLRLQWRHARDFGIFDLLSWLTLLLQSSLSCHEEYYCDIRTVHRCLTVLSKMSALVLQVLATQASGINACFSHVSQRLQCLHCTDEAHTGRNTEAALSAVSIAPTWLNLPTDLIRLAA